MDNNPYGILSRSNELPGDRRVQRTKKTQPIFRGDYRNHMLGEMRHQVRVLYKDHDFSQPLTKEMEGRALKRVGKKRNNQEMIKQGRNMQYGEMSPEYLLQNHPSAFLRRYTIRAGSAMVQHSEAPLGSGFDQKASRDRAFHLVKIDEAEGQFNNMRNATSENISSDGGVTLRKRSGDFSLMLGNMRHQAEQALGEAAEFGPQMRGSFLPMLQAKHEKLTSAMGPKTVKEFKKGRLELSGQHENKPIFTTELTGCSIVRQGTSLAHVRPKGSGEQLQSSFSKGHSFGRSDYSNATHTFTMLRKKPDGRIKLYYQKHFDQGPAVSGSRYLSNK